MENAQWTIVVFPSEMIEIACFADTIIIHCQLSIFHWAAPLPEEYPLSFQDFRADFLQDLPQFANRQTHHIVVIAYHFFRKQRRSALNAVAACFVHGLACGNIVGDFLIR